MENALQRILLVDDEQDIRTIAQLSLESLGGFTIEPCTDGNEAMKKATDFAPELILMDVMMPGKDGPATLRELREISHLEKVPIVFMTARVQKSEVDEYLKLGAAAVISKPFDPMSLPSQIQNIWDGIATK